MGKTGDTRLGRLTALARAGYFFVWSLLGIRVFPLGVALAAVEMQLPMVSRAVPITAGVIGAGLFLIARAAGLG